MATATTLLAGCTSEVTERAAVSKQLRAEVSTLTEAPGLAQLADLRHLAEPTDGLREWFIGRAMVYRVIEASPEVATIALWRRTRAGPEPFNRNRTAIGSACAKLEPAGSVTVRAVTCPHELAGELPDDSAPTWGRAAESRQAVEALRTELDFALWWLLARNADGTQPRREPRGVREVAAAVEKTSRDWERGEHRASAELLQLNERDGRAVGRVRVQASAPDLTHVGTTTTSNRCFTFEVDLSAAPADRQGWAPLVPVVC
ncbi:hypothetical protein HJ590_09865 [Naumannella sp. ID2617S]|nr:hypothetical protein [Naumannella sp. ID2617S]